VAWVLVSAPAGIADEVAVARANAVAISDWRSIGLSWLFPAWSLPGKRFM
jgi:hypothetical protein